MPGGISKSKKRAKPKAKKTIKPTSADGEKENKVRPFFSSRAHHEEDD